MNIGAHLTKRAELSRELEALVETAVGVRLSFTELGRVAHLRVRPGSGPNRAVRAAHR